MDKALRKRILQQKVTLVKTDYTDTKHTYVKVAHNNLKMNNKSTFRHTLKNETLILFKVMSTSSTKLS